MDSRKKDAIKQTLEDQRQFNDRVQKYQQLIKNGQDKINAKKQETELMRNDLEDAMKAKGMTPGSKGTTPDKQRKIDRLRDELNDKVEDMHEIEKNHTVMKNEEEKVIQVMLKELNLKKMQIEKDGEVSDKLLQELERVSREELLQHQEEVDEQEKVLLQCKSDIDRCDEKLSELDKLQETEITKADTELLYIAFLLDKEFQAAGKSEQLADVTSCKTNLEKINFVYKENIENIQRKSEEQWQPLIDSREQSQVVLEDLVRVRGITEVTFTGLKEQFDRERLEELEQIENLRDRLADFEEERNLSGRCSADEIRHVQSDNHEFSFDEILRKEKQK